MAGKPVHKGRLKAREAYAVKVRVLVAAALAVSVALGTAGCNLVQHQATRIQYTPSDGVNVNVGGLDLRNLMIISDNGETGNFLLNAVNSSGKDVKLHIGFISDNTVIDGHVEIPSNAKYPTSFGTKTEDRIILGGINTMPGGLLEVAFEVDGDMKTVLVPVLTSGQPEYNGLAPKNVITISK